MDHQHQSSGRELGGEEINHEEGQELDTTTNSSYDCRFCNRNFTNAQALAGHMNLHPRARGKAAKQAPLPRSSSQATSSSSEEINNDGQELDSTKRPHDCRFCKRGFTNAQALGGHMSIHRRDRAKAAMQAPTNPDHLNLMQSWGADLTLRTGSSNYYQVDEEIKNVWSRRVVSMEAEEELDLELRLGHHP